MTNADLERIKKTLDEVDPGCNDAANQDGTSERYTALKDVILFLVDRVHQLELNKMPRF